MGSHQPAIKRIAIIGAGPTGLACSKYLLAEKAFDVVDIFEQRSRVGGIWNLSSTERSRKIPIPQIDPLYGSWKSSKPRKLSSEEEKPDHDLNNDSLEFESPLYDYLETNIPKALMAYSDKPFRADLPLFPSHQQVMDYLDEYADEVRCLIKFNTQVQDLRRMDSNNEHGEVWELISRDLKSGSTRTAMYDAVVVASGHYTVPKVPEIKGISDWHSKYPGVIMHSKAYRRPEDFSGKRVLVIGNSASGLDIAAQIGKYSANPLILSSRSVSQLASGGTPSWRQDVDELSEFLLSGPYSRAVMTKSGIVIENLDVILFATGYFFSYPFLSSLKQPIIQDGLRVRDVFQHFIHIQYPTLALPVLNLKIIPFPLAENEAAVIARIWAGRLPRPTEDEMRDWEKSETERKGSGKDFHLKRFPEDAAQINDLYRWALSARPMPALENNGNGKLGMTWNQNHVWMRSKFPDIKAAYAEHGKNRQEVKTIEELGFVYDQWIESATDLDKSMFEKAHCSA